MAMLQLLIISNYSRRVIVLRRPYKLHIRFFDTGPDPTRLTQDGKFFDPTRSDPTRPDQTQPVGGPDPCPTLDKWQTLKDRLIWAEQNTLTLGNLSCSVTATSQLPREVNKFMLAYALIFGNISSACAKEYFIAATY